MVLVDSESPEAKFCVESYLNDYDYRFSVDRQDVNNAFINEIKEIINLAYKTAVISGSLSKLYEFVRKKFNERKEKEAQKLAQENKLINTFGNGAVLYYGNVRPFFDIPDGSKLYFHNVSFSNKMLSTATPYRLQVPLQIPKGANLLLQDVVIVYDGVLGKFVKEGKAPNFFLLRVAGIAS